MKFTADALRYFTDGSVGASLLSQHSLPEEVFPASKSWNHFVSLSEAERTELRGISPFWPPPESVAKPQKSVASDHHLSTFLSLNAMAVRFSPNHRLWTSEDIYASHQRTTFGSALMVIQLYLEPSGTFTEPLLVVTGPMATPFQGATWDTREAHALDSSSDIPIFTGDVPYPETIAPTSVSLSATSRQWLCPTDPGSDPIAKARTHGQFLTILDSTRLHSTAAIFDHSNTIASAIASQGVVGDEQLFASAHRAADSDDCTMDSQVLDRWTATGLIPPDPNALVSWDSPEGESLSRDSEEPYEPFLEEECIGIFDNKSGIDEKAGYLLVPHFLRFPITANLPIGLVMRPSDMTGPIFKHLVSVLSGKRDSRTTNWISNALSDAWFEAVSENPHAFAVKAFPHTILLSAIPAAASEPLLSMRLHLEWSLVSQLLWDHAVANATREGNMAGRISSYANALVSANNTPSSADAYCNIWGFIDSVYRHPFLPWLRPPVFTPDNTITALSLMQHITVNNLPGYMKGMVQQSATIGSTKRDMFVEPFLPPPQVDLTLTHEEEPNVDDQSDAGASRSVSQSTSSRYNPLSRKALGRTLASLANPSKRLKQSTGVDLAPTHAHNPPAKPTVLSADPDLLSTVSTFSSTQQNPWMLPCLMRSLTPLPTGTGLHSAALATALRHAQPL
jgi:hypothetical protein